MIFITLRLDCCYRTTCHGDGILKSKYIKKIVRQLVNVNKFYIYLFIIRTTILNLLADQLSAASVQRAT